MKAKVLVPVAAVGLVAGVSLWWQQGGFGGPVSDGAARRYFARIASAALAKDFGALCRLNSSVGTCESELSYTCRPDSGGPLFPPPEMLQSWCLESVPTAPPEIAGSRDHPRRGGYVGGRMLVVRGVDGRRKPYETEVLVIRDKRSYKAIHAVFWSGSKFPTTNEVSPTPPTKTTAVSR